MDYLYAFLVGGVICVIGQILMDTTKLTTPRILVIFVVTGVILGSLQVYEPLVKIANQGATVPLPGFGFALAKGAIAGAKKSFLGAITGAVKETATGVAVSIAFGYIVALLFNPKSPR
ncbi:MAG: stage V sporulation protein AE [Eubacteriales bacterium]|nr:stage V sporulation protein AE [Eubacteriales bacterium]